MLCITATAIRLFPVCYITLKLRPADVDRYIHRGWSPGVYTHTAQAVHIVPFLGRCFRLVMYYNPQDKQNCTSYIYT